MMGSTMRSDFSGRQMVSPVMGCCLMMSHSSGVRLVPFFRISSGTVILPKSCKKPPRRADRLLLAAGARARHARLGAAVRADDDRAQPDGGAGAARQVPLLGVGRARKARHR